MNLMERLFGRSPSSAMVAKERLQLVLAHDRASLSPGELELLKDEIIGVISRHISIDRTHVAFTLSRGPEGTRLVADIPVLRPPSVAHEAPASTPSIRKRSRKTR